MKTKAPITPPVQDVLDGLSSLFITGSTLRSMFVMLTKMHYSSADHFGRLKDKMVNFVWSPDEKKRRLFIDYDYHYSSKDTDRRPAIFVGTGDIEFQKKVVGNAAGSTEDRAGNEQMKLGATTVILRHISKMATDATLLAELSQQFYQMLTPLMLSKVRLHTFEVVKIANSRPFAPVSQEAADTHFISDLILAVSYTNAWVTVHESHPIKTFGFAPALQTFGFGDGHEAVYPEVKTTSVLTS